MSRYRHLRGAPSVRESRWYRVNFCRPWIKGNSDEIGKSWQREILFPDKVQKRSEYCMYFPFSELQSGSKRSAIQPQTVYSKFP